MSVVKLKTYIEEADYFSGKASEINRNLIFAGIAIVWIFKNSTNSEINLPNDLYFPLILFAASLVLDLIQYVVGYLLWSAYVNNKENKDKKEDDDVLEMEWQSVLIDIIWGVKLITNAIAFICLLKYLITHMS